jgi:hypothetical protein
MKKIRGDEPAGVIIHTHMEISQGNSLCSYLYLKREKCHFFFFILQNQKFIFNGHIIIHIDAVLWGWSSIVKAQHPGLTISASTKQMKVFAVPLLI